MKNVEAWAASIVDWPEYVSSITNMIYEMLLMFIFRFVEFGSLPTFVGIWEFASTPQRRTTLQQAYAQFIQLYATDLSLPGPYLRARLTDAIDASQQATFLYTTGSSRWGLNIRFPTSKQPYPQQSNKHSDDNVVRSDDWYFLSPSIQGTLPILARELVPGALAPVKWMEAFTGPSSSSNRVTRFWKAIPPTSDYIAIGFVAMTGSSANAIPSQPPASLAGRFRAVHKLALTGAARGVTNSYQYQGNGGRVFRIDYRYLLADIELPVQGDSFALDPKMIIRDWSGW